MEMPHYTRQQGAWMVHVTMADFRSAIKASEASGEKIVLTVHLRDGSTKKQVVTGRWCNGDWRSTDPTRATVFLELPEEDRQTPEREPNTAGGAGRTGNCANCQRHSTHMTQELDDDGVSGWVCDRCAALMYYQRRYDR